MTRTIGSFFLEKEARFLTAKELKKELKPLFILTNSQLNSAVDTHYRAREAIKTQAPKIWSALKKPTKKLELGDHAYSPERGGTYYLLAEPISQGTWHALEMARDVSGNLTRTDTPPKRVGDAPGELPLAADSGEMLGEKNPKITTNGLSWARLVTPTR